MGQLTAIGFTAGRSLLHRSDPRTKQALLMVLSGLGLWGGTPFLLSMSVVVLFCFHAARLRPVRLILEIRYFLFFLVCIFCLRTVSFGGAWMPVFSRESSGEALLICWRLLLVVLMGLLLMATTRTAHIRAALVWYLRPVPFVDEKMAATMVGLVVRFLPQILFQASEISDAQRARCVERRKNPLYRLKRFSIPLFRRVFLGADELVAAMQARCYNENRTPPDFSFGRSDLIVILSAALIAATIFFS